MGELNVSRTVFATGQGAREFLIGKYNQLRKQLNTRYSSLMSMQELVNRNRFQYDAHFGELRATEVHIESDVSLLEKVLAAVLSSGELPVLDELVDACGAEVDAERREKIEEAAEAAARARFAQLMVDNLEEMDPEDRRRTLDDIAQRKKTTDALYRKISLLLHPDRMVPAVFKKYQNDPDFRDRTLKLMEETRMARSLLDTDMIKILYRIAVDMIQSVQGENGFEDGFGTITDEELETQISGQEASLLHLGNEIEALYRDPFFNMRFDDRSVADTDKLLRESCARLEKRIKEIVHELSSRYPSGEMEKINRRLGNDRSEADGQGYH